MGTTLGLGGMLSNAPPLTPPTGCGIGRICGSVVPEPVGRGGCTGAGMGPTGKGTGRAPGIANGIGGGGGRSSGTGSCVPG